MKNPGLYPQDPSSDVLPQLKISHYGTPLSGDVRPVVYRISDETRLCRIPYSPAKPPCKTKPTTTLNRPSPVLLKQKSEQRTYPLQRRSVSMEEDEGDDRFCRPKVLSVTKVVGRFPRLLLSTKTSRW